MFTEFTHPFVDFGAFRAVLSFDGDYDSRVCWVCQPLPLYSLAVPIPFLSFPIGSFRWVRWVHWPLGRLDVWLVGGGLWLVDIWSVGRFFHRCRDACPLAIDHEEHPMMMIICVGYPPLPLAAIGWRSSMALLSFPLLSGLSFPRCMLYDVCCREFTTDTR
jgi:hypothetical protein